jgi:mRNA interferase YafQ
MYNLRFTNKIQRNIKLMKKRGKDINKLKDIISLLQQGKELPSLSQFHY